MDLTLKSLMVPLPEDIQKLKGYGAFDLAIKIIDSRLQEDIPSILRARLELEKVILQRIPGEYRYSEMDALQKMEAMFHDVTPADLTAVRESDAADWYYVDGELRFKNDFLENITKTRAAWDQRVRPGMKKEDREGNFSLLDGEIAKMKRDGGSAYRMTVEMSLKIRPDVWQPNKTLRVHLPLPVEYAQVRNVEIMDIAPKPAHIGAPRHPQRTVYFEGIYDAEEVFSVRFSFENHTAYVNPDPAAVSALQPTFYTEESPPHIVFTPLIRDVVREVVGTEQNPLIKARKIYDYVTQKIIYSFMRPYITLTNIPEYCITSRKGDCGVLSLTFITLCRAAGIPARWQSGMYANPLSIGNHDWAEFYVEPYGWIFADPSFGGSAHRAKNTERHDFYATNIDPFRIPYASAFQHPMHPPLKHLRNDPYDNQNGEAEYEDRPLFGDERITKSTMIAIEPIEYAEA